MFGERLKILRKDINLSQADLGKVLDYTPVLLFLNMNLKQDFRVR